MEKQLILSQTDWTEYWQENQRHIEKQMPDECPYAFPLIVIICHTGYYWSKWEIIRSVDFIDPKMNLGQLLI